MKVDKMGMAASLEARCPLLDHALVEYAALLPAEWKQSCGKSKRVLRRAVEDLLPEAVLTRPKHGFDVPLGLWLERDLSAVVDRLVLAEDSALSSWLRPAGLRQLWNRWQRSRDERLALAVWRLLNLALWSE